MNICAVIICAVSCFIPAVTNNFITDSFSDVRMVASISQDNAVIAALVTKPLFTKSDRDALMKKVAERLIEEYGYDRVTVTLDSDIYSAIELNIYNYNELDSKIKMRGTAYVSD